jgi:anti-sigma-K factor RskA
VNPEFHDEFVALVPLFYSGELTDEEWALLQVHMAYCDSCREVFEQHEQIATEVIPAMASSAAAQSPRRPEESEGSLREAERQLMNRLQGQQPSTPKEASRSPWAWISTGAIAACVGGALVYAGFRYLRPFPQQPIVASSRPSAVPPLNTSAPDPQKKADEDAVARADEKVSSLQGQLSAAEKGSADAKVALTEERHHFQTEEAQQQQLVAQRDALSQQLATAQTEAQSLRDKLAAVQTGTGQQSARMTELEAKVQRLNVALDDANASLDSKDRIIEFDKDLMLHDRDIRDVIGARNLYIADIYDTNLNGSTAKPFGRIFYTKDSSLVFYGFDLDKQAGVKQSAAFQAWGSGTDRRPVSLGLFYQDDGHKHWVLKCRDAATLARLNMVFVTVEPPGGSSKPTGKQFLRAYLQIQPNHP